MPTMATLHTPLGGGDQGGETNNGSFTCGGGGGWGGNNNGNAGRRVGGGGGVGEHHRDVRQHHYVGGIRRGPVSSGSIFLHHYERPSLVVRERRMSLFTLGANVPFLFVFSFLVFLFLHVGGWY
jgi:hypothetical protein